jgi:ActR/RegA family two-component response regulator
MPPRNNSLERRRILIVEDDYAIASEVARAFQQHGAEVVGPVPTLATAFDVVESDLSIELAVLDINLRGEMVYPLAEALESRGVPFVFATGYDASALPDRFRHVPLLTKPADFGAIASELSRIGGFTAAAAAAGSNRCSFRVVSRQNAWNWEVVDRDGERIASGSSNSSEAARAAVYRALLRGPPESELSGHHD